MQLSKEQIAINRLVCGNTAHSCKADYIKLAIKALETRIKVKEYIGRINQPEYQNITWKKDEVVLLLKELLAE